MTRILLSRPTGLEEAAPFWRGARAETIVAARVASYPKRAARGTGTARQRSPNAELRRLERALARRKTLAAQQRIQQQIAALRAQLG